MILAPPLATVTVRPLAAEEFGRLADLPIGARGLPDPATTAIVVAETSDGQIVGVWGAFPVVHLDGLWVHPDYRKHTSVAARLLRGMKTLLAQLGLRYSFTIVEDPTVLILALKAGFRKLPHDLCFLDLGED